MTASPRSVSAAARAAGLRPLDGATLHLALRCLSDAAAAAAMGPCPGHGVAVDRSGCDRSGSSGETEEEEGAEATFVPAVGHRVQVYSHSKSRWEPATVRDVDAGARRVDITYLDGGGGKWIDWGSDDIREQQQQEESATVPLAIVLCV